MRSHPWFFQGFRVGKSSFNRMRRKAVLARTGFSVRVGFVRSHLSAVKSQTKDLLKGTNIRALIWKTGVHGKFIA